MAQAPREIQYPREARWIGLGDVDGWFLGTPLAVVHHDVESTFRKLAIRVERGALSVVDVHVGRLVEKEVQHAARAFDASFALGDTSHQHVDQGRSVAKLTHQQEDRGRKNRGQDDTPRIPEQLEELLGGDATEASHVTFPARSRTVLPTCGASCSEGAATTSRWRSRRSRCRSTC